MLESIEKDGYFYWRCHDEECARLMRAHVLDSGVVFQSYHPESGLPGSVIALPRCVECSSQMFLKADYTLKELLTKQVFIGFRDPSTGQQRGWAMKLGHARNFRLLNLLFEAGKLPAPPLLKVLPAPVIDASPLAGVPYHIVDSFWLAYSLLGQAPNYQGLPAILQGILQGLLKEGGSPPLLGKGNG